MFNDINHPTAANSAVDDIFAETEGGTRPSSANNNIETQPAGLSASPYAAEGGDDKGSSGSKMKLILIIILAALILGAAAYLIYSKFIKPSAETALLTDSGVQTPEPIVPSTPVEVDDNTVVPQVENENTEVATSTEAVETPVVATGTPEVNTPVDSDGDSLMDAEEASLGTNPSVIDSDFDGLSDYEEVKVYGTNPLNPDTDGDTFTDGDEVKNGYNPKGDGKLQ